MERKNICRAVTFYNNFLPANNVVQPWKYCAFGVVDGIDVSADIAVDGERIPDCIWEEQKKSVRSLKGEYTTQQIYILKNACKQKEEEFWADKEYPFLFFLRIQCRGNKEALLKNKETLENCLQIEGEIKTTIYLTYDNSDLFVVMKSKLYEQGAGMIDTLHKRVNFSKDEEKICYLKNSFTVFAVDHAWIDGLEKQTSETLVTKFIDEVLIKVIEKERGDVQKIKQELEERKNKTFANKDDKNTVLIDVNSILGADDEWISIKNISWFDFFSLYRKKDGKGIEGVFCNSNELYYNNMAGATTAIRTKLKNYTEYLRAKGIKFLSLEDVERERTGEKNSDAYGLQIKSLIAKLDAINEVVDDFKELRLILNVLSKFGGEVFNDYVFFPTIGAIDALLELLASEENKCPDKDYFFDFLKGFSMYIQGSGRSDRHSMQAMDFNAKIYDIPSKLNSFYCAFIYHVKDILGGEQNQGEPHKYDFLLVPGMDSLEKVIELYPKVLPARHLMKVEIPECNFYHMRDMMIILSHETAHYVGGKYRRREERYKAFVESYAHIYVCYVRHYLQRNEITIANEISEIIELRARMVLISALERESNKEYLEKVKLYNVHEKQYKRIRNRNEKYQYYFSVILRNIDTAMIDIVQYDIDNIFSPILYERNEGDKREIREVIVHASERFLNKYEAGSTLLSSSTALAALQLLYEESFVDLMSILLLNINIKDYVNGILHNAKRQGMKAEELWNSEAAYRIVVVFLCVTECKVDGMDVSHIYDSFTEEDTEGKSLLNQSVFMWNREKMQPSDIYLKKDYAQDITNIHKDVFIFDTAKKYLLECCKEFIEDVGKKATGIEQLRKLFQQISDSNEASVEEQITLIMEFIEEYREKTLCELNNKEKSNV